MFLLFYTYQSEFIFYPFLQFVGIFRYFRKYRLCHSVYHAQYELLSHAAPFVGLVVIAHFYLGVVLTQYDGEEIVVDVIEYVGN